MAEPSLSDLADEIEAAAKAALRTTSRVTMFGPESLNLWAAALRSAEEEIKRLRGEITEWKEVGGYREQAEHERGLKEYWRKSAEANSAALAKMREALGGIVEAAQDGAVDDCYLIAKEALARHVTEGK